MDASYRNRLEGGYRLLRVRNIKAWTHAALILATAALVAFSLYSGGATLKPLYIPLEALLPPVLVMILIGSILEMFFRTLEIRFASREAQKFLMVMNTMSRISFVIIVCGLLVAILLFPPAHRMISGPETTDLELLVLSRQTSGPPLRVDSADPLGGVRYPNLLVQISSGRGLQVIMEKDGLTLDPETITNGGLTEIPLDRTGVHTYIITFYNPTLEPVTFTYALRRVVLPSLSSVVPGFAIALMIACAGFFFYLQPLRTKSQKASIFSTESADVVAPGERLYAEYQRPSHSRITPAGLAPGGDHPQEAPITPAPFVNASPSVPRATPIAVEVPIPAEPRPETPIEAVPEDLFAQGANLYTGGDYYGAIAKFDEILQTQPRVPIVLNAKGNALLKLGRVQGALAIFEEVLGINASDQTAIIGKSDALAQEKRWRDVLDLIDDALVARPGDPAMLERKGDALLALYRRQEAQIAFEAALARKPTDPALLAKLDQAKVDVATLQSRALIASASGNVEESVHLLDQVLKLEPENVNALVAKATALRRAGRLEGAVECLDHAIALKPDHGGALLTRGRIFEDRGMLDDALDTYDRLVELGPTDTDAWVAQGNVLVKMGRSEDALRSYKEALKISPDDEDLRARLGGLDSARAQHDQLIRELLQIKGIGPARAKALQDTGFVTQDDFRKATEDDLLKVHGITRKVAADILAHFRGQVALDAE